MRLGWAIAAGLLGGAALAWWLTPAGSRFNPLAGDARPAAGETRPGGQDQAPALYRWRDAQGMLHVSQQRPPAGQDYERVSIPEDRNIVPLAVPPDPD